MTLHYAGFIVLAIISIQTRVLGDELVLACQTTPDCSSIEGAECLAEKCVCPGGHVLSSNMVKCLPVAGGFGGPCDDSVQCAVRMLTGATCSKGGMCECAAGYHYLHGRCWRSAGLNEACTTSDQCYGNYNYESLSCTGGVCVCSADFYLHDGGTYCRREGKEIGDECMYDFDCKFEGGKCNSVKECEGSTSRWKEVVNNISNNIITNDEEEEEEEDEFEEFHLHNDAYLGEACTNDEECKALDDNSVCNSGKACWCSQGYYFNGTRCVKELGETCTADDNCNHIDNAKCRMNDGDSEGSCSCIVQFTAGTSNQICIKLKPGIEFNCQSMVESCQNFGPLCSCMIDTSNTCECLPGSHFEDLPQQCWMTKGLNEVCTDNRDCVTDSGAAGVDCIDGTCQCIDKYHDTDGDCRKDALIYGDACIDDVDCLFANPKCTSKKCRCATGYFAQNDTSGIIACVTGVGGKCMEDTECSLVENSVCNSESEICECNSNHVSSVLHDKCLTVAQQYGDMCTEKAQCQSSFGDDIDCVEERCVCNEGFHFRGKSCWPKTNLKEKCSYEDECYLESDSERTQCRNGFCECKYDFVATLDNEYCSSDGTTISLNMGVFAVISIIVVITSTL